MKLFRALGAILRVPFLLDIFVVLQAIVDVCESIQEDIMPSMISVNTVVKVIKPKLGKRLVVTATTEELQDFVLAAAGLYLTAKKLLK